MTQPSSEAVYMDDAREQYIRQLEDKVGLLEGQFQQEAQQRARAELAERQREEALREAAIWHAKVNENAINYSLDYEAEKKRGDEARDALRDAIQFIRGGLLEARSLPTNSETGRDALIRSTEMRLEIWERVLNDLGQQKCDAAHCKLCGCPGGIRATGACTCVCHQGLSDLREDL